MLGPLCSIYCALMLNSKLTFHMMACHMCAHFPAERSPSCVERSPFLKSVEKKPLNKYPVLSAHCSNLVDCTLLAPVLLSTHYCTHIHTHTHPCCLKRKTKGASIIVCEYNGEIILLSIS